MEEKDLKIGQEFYILNSKNFSIYKDTTEKVGFFGIGDYGYPKIKMKKFRYEVAKYYFIKCIDADVRKGESWFICDSIRFKRTQTSYYVFTTKQKAQDFLVNVILPYKLKNLTVLSEHARQQYMKLVDEFGKTEERIKKETEKLKALNL